MTNHILLFFMAISYIGAIVYTTCHLDDNTKSISQVISQSQHRPILGGFMGTMAAFTLMYEWIVGNATSIAFILALLVGIAGVIIYEETAPIHYVFAFAVFASILGFMRLYSTTTTTTTPFYSLQKIIAEIVLLCLQTDVFIPEVAFLGNFAAFYICLHFLRSQKI